jgi:hypothetical protein
MSFKCEICNSDYKSYQSYWNHNKIKHPENKNKNNKKILKCQNCNKEFSTNHGLKYHNENVCKLNPTQELKNEIIELKKTVENLQTKTLTNNINTNNSHNNNNTNNGTINNVKNIIYINKTGTENVLELNDKELHEIFSKEISGIITMVKLINFNERLPSNHSFCATSLEGKYLSVYNTEEARIESTRKKYFYHELLTNAVDKMELLYKMYKGKFKDDRQKQIKETIETLKEIKEFDFSNKVLKEITNKLIEISYNNNKTVLNTWNNNTLMSKEEREERDKKYLEELKNMDTGGSTLQTENYLSDSISDDESDSEIEKSLPIFVKKYTS